MYNICLLSIVFVDATAYCCCCLLLLLLLIVAVATIVVWLLLFAGSSIYCCYCFQETLPEDVCQMLKEIEMEQSYEELLVLRKNVMKRIKKERTLAEVIGEVWYGVHQADGMGEVCVMWVGDDVRMCQTEGVVWEVYVSGVIDKRGVCVKPEVWYR